MDALIEQIKKNDKIKIFKWIKFSNKKITNFLGNIRTVKKFNQFFKFTS